MRDSICLAGRGYRRRCGFYPQKVLADPNMAPHANRRYLKSKGILFAGKPLGRPHKVAAANRQELQRLKAQRREDYRQRIPIEGKFGQGTKLSAQLHSRQMCGHLRRLDQQHLPGDGTADLVEDLFLCCVKKAVAAALLDITTAKDVVLPSAKAAAQPLCTGLKMPAL